MRKAVSLGGVVTDGVETVCVRVGAMPPLLLPEGPPTELLLDAPAVSEGPAGSEPELALQFRL